jgi:hypothetical protein
MTLPPEGISQSAWDEATKADAKCAREGCKRPECNGFLCRDAVEAYAASIRQGSQPSNVIPVRGTVR